VVKSEFEVFKKIKKLFAPASVLSSEEGSDTNEALMLKVRDGDQAAFEKLYGKLRKPIMSYVYGFVSNLSVAEEITQEVFLKVYRVRETYAPTAKFSTWLWTITRNAVIDHLRKKHEVLVDDLNYVEQQKQGSSVEQIESELPNSEAMLVANTENISVHDCLKKLSASQRDALQLRIFSDLSYEEIAETLKTTVTSVKTLLFRAKQGMLGCIKKKELIHE